MADPGRVQVQESEREFRHMRCPECQRVASVPNWCARPVCVHGSDGCTPEVWDGDDPHGAGRPIEWSENEMFRSPGPRTWAAMVPLEVVPRSEAEALAEALERAIELGQKNDDTWMDEDASALNALVNKAADYRSRHPKETP